MVSLLIKSSKKISKCFNTSTFWMGRPFEKGFYLSICHSLGKVVNHQFIHPLDCCQPASLSFIYRTFPFYFSPCLSFPNLFLFLIFFFFSSQVPNILHGSIRPPLSQFFLQFRDFQTWLPVAYGRRKIPTLSNSFIVHFLTHFFFSSSSY